MRPAYPFALAGLLALAVASTPSSAAACGSFGCLPPNLVPWSGPVPAQLSGVALLDGQDGVTLVVREGGPSGAVLADSGVLRGADNELAFVRPLTPGNSYRFELTSCDQRTLVTEVTVEAASPVPTSLGSLTVLGSGMAGGGALPDPAVGCERPYEPLHGYVTLELDLSALSPGWRNVLRAGELVVDGTPRPDRLGKPLQRLISNQLVHQPDQEYSNAKRTLKLSTTCEDDDIAPGQHTVLVRATVPEKSPRVIESNAVVVELKCPQLSQVPSPPADAYDAGAPGNSSSDAGMVAAARVDAGEVPWWGDDTVEPSEGPRAGCDTNPGRSANAGSALLFAALLVWAARQARVRTRR